MADREPGFNTLAIHAGAQPDPATGARATPIYQTTSFVFDDVDHAASLFGLQAFGNIYTRIGNPTNAVLEERVAALEGGTARSPSRRATRRSSSPCTPCCSPATSSSRRASSMAARSTSSIIPIRTSAGTSCGRRPTSPRPSRSRCHASTKAIFVELIANPGGVIVDLEAIARSPRRTNVPLIVDNTMATPYLWRPFEHGADIIVHSATKFLGGHGNSIGGVIVDGGKFNWTGDDRYPMLSKPRPEYGGMVLGETFGNFAFAIATACWACATWGRRCRRSTPS